MGSYKKVFFPICSILLISAAIPFGYAQRGTSRLEGTVKDSTGAVVAGASVTAKNEETGVGTEVFSTDTGAYVFPALPAGIYSATVELPGFKRVTVEKLKLDIAATHVQNFALEVGQIQETVTVTATGLAQVQTTTSDIGDTVQAQTIQQLPLNGRQALELIALQAGIAGNQQMSERGSASSQGTNFAGLGANGARAVNNAVYLDGVDITNSEAGTGAGISVGTELSQSVDAIGEFRVISANPTAEFGKNSGLQVEIVTRSGTNEFHGSLYHFHRNTLFNANDFFNNVQGTNRPKLIRNQFGGTLGGPVRLPGYNGKNKTFFFVNYEGFRQRQGSIEERTVLTQDARNGIFRFNRNGPNSPSLVDPNTGQVLSQFANQIGTFDAPNLDKTRWDGIGKDTSGVIDRYIKLMPLPNFFGNPGGNRDGLNFASYRFNAPSPDDRDNLVVKFDHVLSPKHNVSVRYSHGFLTRLADLEPYPGLPNRTRDEFQRGVSINIISHLTNTVTNEFRFGFSRNRRTFSSLIRPNDIVIDCNSSFDCLGTTNPDLTGESSVTARQTAQFTNNISWTKGNHFFKGGLTVRANPLNVRADSNQINMDFNSEPRNQQNASVDLGQLFGGTIPINATDRINAANFFNFHTGRVGGVIAGFNATDVTTWGPLGSARVRGFRQREWGAFFQDDWRFNRKLTLNLGVRYELFEVPYEVNSFYTIPINRNLLDPQIDVNLVAPPLEFGA
ncbi:MAG: TonB-dependent receptor, partial [Acidobacteria bacterium]|nr:TonB-dependent receptor [Acidobacteriota bacterium]